jgi:carbon storage regulator
MLVLSRKKDESIVINNDITIVVVEIRGDKVRLGVEAPKEVPVHRREVYDAIARGEPLEIQLGSHSQLAPSAQDAADEEIAPQLPIQRPAHPEDSRPPANDAIP